jgi:hypothetical protein
VGGGITDNEDLAKFNCQTHKDLIKPSDLSLSLIIDNGKSSTKREADSKITSKPPVMDSSHGSPNETKTRSTIQLLSPLVGSTSPRGRTAGVTATT